MIAEVDTANAAPWVYAISGAATAYVTVLIGWFWKTEIRKCRRCHLRSMYCDCLGGPR